MRSELGLLAVLLLFILLRTGVLAASEDDGVAEGEILDDQRKNADNENADNSAEPRRNLGLDEANNGDNVLKARVSKSKCPKLRLKNGRVRLRGGGRVTRFICSPGYDMIGKRFATCVRGHWTNPPPICVARGCDALIPPKNGHIVDSYKGALLNFDCDPGYELSGAFSIHCDGFRWNASVPNCQPPSTAPATECDFETEDLCGWLHDPSHDFDWKRHNFATPSGHVGTGPSHDHTLGEGREGHYLYIEASSPRKENDTARLLSPVYSPDLSDNGCFTFWYHMYGATSGFLRVFVKPESMKVEDLPVIFAISGDQGNTWFEGAVRVPSLQENFQIVVEGIRGTSYVSDTAIDDVKLANSTECVMTHTPKSHAGETSRNISGSCSGRCNVSTTDDEQCQCTSLCLGNKSCCSDYDQECMSNGPSSESIPYNSTAMISSVDVTASPTTLPIVVTTATPDSSTRDFFPSLISSSFLSSGLPQYSSFSVSSVTPSVDVKITSSAAKQIFTSFASMSSLSPVLKTTSSVTPLMTSSPLFASSSFDILPSFVESSVLTTSSSVIVLPQFSSPKVTPAETQSVLVTSVKSSELQPISSITSPFDSVITSVQNKSPIVSLSSSDFTTSIAASSVIVSSTVTSSTIAELTTVTIFPSTYDMSASVFPSEVETLSSVALMSSDFMRSTEPLTESPTLSQYTSVSVQPTDIVKITTSSPSEVPSITPTNILPAVMTNTTGSPKSKTLLPRRTTTSTPLSGAESFKKPESSARTENTAFPAAIAGGLVVALILFGVIVAAAAYFVFKRRKLRREKLAEDSDVRYLKDGCHDYEDLDADSSDGSLYPLVI